MQREGQKQMKMRNIIFPVWLLWMLPPMWLVVLPLNYLIDLAVIRIWMHCRQIAQAGAAARRVIVRVWLCGFIADIFGTALMFTVNLLPLDYGTTFGRWWYENICNAISYQPFENLWAFGYVTL